MREQWMGQKGFDEAQYYNDETDHLGSGEENDSVIRTKKTLRHPKIQRLRLDKKRLRKH